LLKNLYLCGNKASNDLLMTLKNTIMSLALGLAGIATAIAGPVDEARKLYRSGDYVAAAELMKPVVKRSPKDGNANFFYGASLFQLGDYAGAEGPLTVAEGRSVAEAAQILAGMSLDRYDVDGAEEHLDKWAAILKKGKKSIPSEHDAMNSRLIRLRNMLDRVERIEILDSLSVDSADFFSYYRLSREAGRILPPDAVGRLVSSGFDDELSTAYMPENNTEILWSAADSTGTYRLYGADILDDGTVDHAAPLDDKLGEGGDAKFPFLMPDGVTLYYANNGENSIGGYDIFMTRSRDGEDGKDYLLAIDEETGIGWWATYRNRVPGKVTIYVFAPSQMRVNADPDDPNLAALAMLSDTSLSRREGVDYEELLASRLPQTSDEAGHRSAASPRFALDMGNGKVYYRLSDFSNERARSAMLDALGAEARLRNHLEAEEAMREKYRRGDRSLAGAILESERQTETLRRQAASQRNTAVRLETR